MHIAVLTLLAAAATWTGRQQDHGGSISCEYELDGRRDWRVFPLTAACPATAELLTPVQVRRRELEAAFEKADALRPGAGWYAPIIVVAVLGALALFLGFAFDSVDRCGLFHSSASAPCRGFDLTRSSPATLLSWFGGAVLFTGGVALGGWTWTRREPANQLERELDALPAR